MEEIWKDIYFKERGKTYDYRGLYQISSKGRIKSLEKIYYSGRNHNLKKIQLEQILSPSTDKGGYKKIVLNNNGKKKTMLIHRLVAHMFIPNPHNYIIVNHKDENPSNNYVENLEWCTQEYNCNYGSRNKRIGEKQNGEKNHMYGKYGINNERSIKIVGINIETNMLLFYHSAVDLEKDKGFSRKRINKVTKDNHEKHKEYKAYGYKWFYLNDFLKLNNLEYLIN